LIVILILSRVTGVFVKWRAIKGMMIQHINI